MRPATQTVVLNGAHAEGGSALFRTALLCSALTQQAVRIHHVRGATRKPGLTAEDLCVVEILRTSTRAKISGDELGSEEILFEPKNAPRPVRLDYDIHQVQAGKVPGSLVVAAQSVLPLLARTGAICTLTLEGETHNNNVLGYDAFERSTLAAHRRQGIYAYPSLQSTGFGFAGHGKLHLEIEPSALEPIAWDRRGSLLNYGVVITSTDAPNPTVREAVATAAQLLQSLGNAPEIDDHEVSGKEAGFSVTFFAEYECGFGSGSAVWQKGTSGAATANRAWESFQEWHQTDATVDAYLADQLLFAACMTPGRTVYTTPNVTRRLSTVAYVIKQFMPIPITIKGRESTPGTIIVER